MRILRYAAYAALLLVLVPAVAQEASPADPQQRPEAQKPEAQKPIDQTLVYKAETPTSQEVFKQSEDAKNFKFGKTETEFYKQIEAFDKYIADKGWIYTDPVVTGYVERIGRSVVPSAPMDNVKFKFFVLRDPEPNAFALPNGSIYVNSGLLSRLENEAQLAGVLAHESTHVFNRHTYNSYHDMRKKVVLIEVLDVGLNAAYLGGANVGILNAIGNLVPIAVVETIFGYRRELEHEADVYAVSVMREAGYDPMEMSRALEMLKKGPEVDLTQESYFWADHPKLESRVKDTAELAKKYGPPAGGGKVLEADFIASTKNAVRHDAGLAMMLGHPRTAVAIANRLIMLEPNNADNYALLGDAYRSLGGRTAIPTADELTDGGKKQMRKLMRKKTQQEFEKALMELPVGKDNWSSNCREAEAQYNKALDLDHNNANAFRGMGLLRESQERPQDAVESLKKYLELVPNAKDARFVRQHIDTLQKKSGSDQPAAGGK